MNLEFYLKNLPKIKAPKNFTDQTMLKLGLVKKPIFNTVFFRYGLIVILMTFLAINLYQAGITEIINLWIKDGKILSMELNDWLTFLFEEFPLGNLVLVLITGFYLLKKPKLSFWSLFLNPRFY